MILHPDGRVEGTPEEIAQVMKLTGPVKETKTVIRWVIQPTFVPGMTHQPYPRPFWDITCSGTSISAAQLPPGSMLWNSGALQ